ncbi:hypothetical protein KA005_30800, partial [bacterium]|nr:hypothetical protein [bacterium]
MNEHEKFNRRKRCLELLEHRQRALYLDGDFVIGEVKPESHNANSTTELQWDIEGIRRLIGYHKVLNEYRDTIEF